MSNKKNFYSRSAYTFLTLLGDFGGFNDAIVYLISIFMSVYSAKMYAAHITSELPLLGEPSTASIRDIRRLQDKARRGESLNRSDMETLSEYLSKASTKEKTPFW